MKKSNIILIIGVVLVALLLINKIMILETYKSEKYDIDNNSIFNETLNIMVKQDLDDEDITELDGLIVKKFDNDYYMIEDSPSIKAKKDSEGKVVSFYSYASIKQYKDLLGIESFELYEVMNPKNPETEKYVKRYLDRKGVKNDIDLLNLLKENYYYESSIFTSITNIKIHYILNNIISVVLPSFNSITLIDGDLHGYILNGTNIKEVHLINNDKQYLITFGGELNNIDTIKGILETVRYK